MKEGKIRKSNRWSNWDYDDFGYYFITICTKGRFPYFGAIPLDSMILSKEGKILDYFIQQISSHYQGVHLDEYVVMPNHAHAILLVSKSFVGTGHCPVPTRYGLLSKIVNSLKNFVTKNIRRDMSNEDFGWQRSFHDHVIRTPAELERIRKYIRSNPKNWDNDRNNPKNLKKIYDGTNLRQNY